MTTHTTTTAMTDEASVLFTAFASALRADPSRTYVWLPDQAAALCAHYNLSHLQSLINKVPRVLEYWIEDGAERSVAVEKARVIEHVRQGRTLICNGMHHGDPQSAIWSSRLQEVLDLPGKNTARIFYTNAIEQAYGMHLDPFYTLTLQVSGSKLWKIARYREAIDINRLNHSILAPEPGVIEMGPYGQLVGPEVSAELFDEVLLQPGDALLIAPGVWHHVIPVCESFSVALDVVPESQPDSALEIALIRHTP